jgi:hypothetical protein
MVRVLGFVVIAFVVNCTWAQDGWKLETDAAAWSPRMRNAATVFQDRVWIYGGSGGSVDGSLPDAWSSYDGRDWYLEGGYLPWGYRSSPRVTLFNSRLWLLGGRTAIWSNDVWSTDDGVSWIEETPAAPWLGRESHVAIAFNGQMWVIGGWTRQNNVYMRLNDIWSSTDGVNWTSYGNAPWAARSHQAAIVFNNRLWVVGGVSSTAQHNDVWSSADGINWTLEVADAPWPGRGGHTLTFFRDRLWLMAGVSAVNSDAVNDVWTSVDGVNWERETVAAPWSERFTHSAVEFNGRLWVFGGAGPGYQSTLLNDVWSYGLHASPDDLAEGVVGHPYSASVTAREGDGPFVWEIVGGSLPPGLFIDTSGSGDTVPITGVPEAVGEYSFTIRLTDSNNYTTEQPIHIKINPPPPIGGGGTSGSSGCALSARPVMAVPGGTTALAAMAAATAYALRPRRRQPRSPNATSA